MALSLLLALSGGMGWRLAMGNTRSVASQAASQSELKLTDNSRKVLYWYDPMMPLQHFEQPGKSPFMDMQLIAKYAEPLKNTSEGTVSELSIDPVVAQNIGVRLARVSRMPLTRQIEATGLMAFNERDAAVVQTRSSGFVEHVWSLAVGDVVKAGQPLTEILVPEWAAAQQEFLAVRSFADTALLAAARERLQLLGMSKSMIQKLERTRIVQSRYTISAPIAGVIQAIECVTA